MLCCEYTCVHWVCVRVCVSGVCEVYVRHEDAREKQESGKTRKRKHTCALSRFFTRHRSWCGFKLRNDTISRQSNWPHMTFRNRHASLTCFSSADSSKEAPHDRSRLNLKHAFNKQAKDPHIHRLNHAYFFYLISINFCCVWVLCLVGSCLAACES